jgi:hypothetical protein
MEQNLLDKPTVSLIEITSMLWNSNVPWTSYRGPVNEPFHERQEPILYLQHMLPNLSLNINPNSSLSYVHIPSFPPVLLTCHRTT